jgi:uncharacterized protein
LSLITFLYKTGFFQFLFNPLAKVGRMALSNYIMQTIICSLIFYGIGLQYFGKLQRFELYYVLGAIWIFQIIFSNIWMNYFTMGPLEWCWRRLTYNKFGTIKPKKAVEPDLVPA